MARSTHSLQARTIRDFGVQWQEYRDYDDGYYASLALLKDVLGPLIEGEELEGARVAEIGSGTGRIVRMLLHAGIARIWALEPSAAFSVLRDNLEQEPRVELLNLPGQELPADLDLDLIFIIGVLHHIPNPRPTLQAVREALRPGGSVLIWVYGREGNGLYLSLVLPLRFLTSRLPHAIVAGLVPLLDAILRLYLAVGKRIPVPAHQYLRKVLGPLTTEQRRLVIYDQLKPAYARYYRRSELENLLRTSGFDDIRLHHRHGYSWTARARKATARGA